MSYSIAFMTFNVRFFTSFCVVASPVLYIPTVEREISLNS